MTVEVGRRLTLRADPPSQHVDSGPLIGRDSELTRLRDALRASEVDGRSVVIAGDAGMGKSVLLAAFLADVQRSGVRAVEGACVEIESRRPFGAFADVVASCQRAFGAERVERSLAERGVHARQLVSPDASATARAGDRYQVHTAILGLLSDLANDGPLAVCLEDLHWADAASLELFGYLARRLRSRPVLLVATYRTDELDRRHPLRVTLADLRKARLIEELPLPALDVAGTDSLIRARLALRDAAPLDLREFRELVHARCEGNPLHTEETLDTLRQSGRLRYADGAWTSDVLGIKDALPRSVSDGVIARWSDLSPAAQHVALVASVVGHRFDVELLAAATDTRTDAIAPLIREAIDARLVLEEVEGRPLSFRHALTREALRQQLLHSERVAIHAKIAAFLEGRRETIPVSSAELAYHLEESGDHAKARRHHEAAAREAAAMTDYAGAARSLERAIATAADGDHEQGRRHLDLVELLLLSGDRPRALRAATAALEIGERTDDAGLQGQALLELQNAEESNSNEAQGYERLDRALALLEPLGPSPLLARAYSMLAGNKSRHGDGDGAVALAERARQIAAALALPSELSRAMQQVGIGRALQGRFAEAVAASREAAEIASQAGLVQELYGSLMTLRVQLVAAGATAAEQREVLLRMRALTRAHGLGKHEWIVRELGFLHQEADWDGFLKLLDQVPEPERSDVDQPRLMAILTAIARGGPSELGSLDGARMRAAYGNSAPASGWAAEVLLIAGRASEAVTFASTVTDEETRGRYWGLIPASVVHAIGLFAAYECDDLEARDRFVASLLTERPLPVTANFNRRHVAFAKADIAERAGRIDDALSAYATALAECQMSEYNNNVMFLMTLLRRRRAELYLRLTPPDTASAQAELAALLPCWQKAKARWYLGQLREWAVQHGLAFPESVEGTAETPAPRQLTRRELEIARLVAQGLTNREVGERLSLSVRTAEGHVEQIRSKLGFKTRAQIASWVTERYGAQRAN